MRRILASLSGLVLGIAMAAVVVQTPALAAWSCPPGTACLYSGANGTGERKVIAWTKHMGPCYDLSSAWNNVARSIRVDYGSGRYLDIYDRFCGQGGFYVPLAPYGSNYNLAEMGWDRRVSAFAISGPR